MTNCIFIFRLPILCSIKINDECLFRCLLAFYLIVRFVNVYARKDPSVRRFLFVFIIRLFSRYLFFKSRTRMENENYIVIFNIQLILQEERRGKKESERLKRGE